jgi:hypothetical protein
LAHHSKKIIAASFVAPIIWMHQVSTVLAEATKRHRTHTLNRITMSRKLSYMKNEDVNTRPVMNRGTAKKGYSF